MQRSASYHLVEPHPSVPQTRHPAIHTQRGGAGNVINLKNTRTTDSQTATGPASRTRLDTRGPPANFTSGRGGAGNVHKSSERAIFSFDEELERDLRRAAPVYHVGRGGAGNTVRGRNTAAARTGSESTTNDAYSLNRPFSRGSTATNSSSESAGDRARGKALRGLEKGWGKLKGMA